MMKSLVPMLSLTVGLRVVTFLLLEPALALEARPSLPVRPTLLKKRESRGPFCTSMKRYVVVFVGVRGGVS